MFRRVWRRQNRAVQHSNGRITDRIIRRWRPPVERPLVQQYPCMESWTCRRRCSYDSGCPRSSPGSVCYSGFHYGWRKRRPAVLRIKNNLHKKLPMELFLSGVFLWLSHVVTRHRTEVNSPRGQRRFSSELKRTEQQGERNWAARRRRLDSETEKPPWRYAKSQ